MALGLVGFFVLLVEGRAAFYPDLTWAIQALVALIAASVLLVAGRNDRRARDMGITFLLTSGSFTFRFIQDLAAILPSGIAPIIGFFGHLTLDALLPFYFWRFSRAFPRSLTRKSWAMTTLGITYFALAVGVFLIAANAMLYISGDIAGITSFDRFTMDSSFQTLVYGLTFPGLIYIWIKTLFVREEEKRRVIVFNIGILVGMMPSLSFILIYSLSPEFAKWAMRPETNRMLMPLLQGFVLVVPIVTTYSVIVERMLPVRMLLKQSMRYGVGRVIILFGIFAPVLLVAWYFWALRDQPIASILTTANGVYIVIAAGIFGFAILNRNNAYSYLDRIFFREVYNSDKILRELSDKLHDAKSTEELVEIASAGIIQALHPEAVYFLTFDRDACLREVNSRLLPLESGKSLYKYFHALRDPLYLGQFEERNPDSNLSDAEMRWLMLSGIELLIPIIKQNQHFGLLGLGPRLSELSYISDDEELLELVCRSCASTFSSGSLLAGAVSAQHAAQECDGCGQLMGSDSVECSRCCSTSLKPAYLPRVLNDKYKIDRRIGKGGMGVVYRAQDLSLNRVVVIKTLNNIGDDELPLFQKEAQTMASINHANIATVYGFETHMGRAMLIYEFLDGGTLEEKISEQAVGIDQVVAWGIALAGALSHLHDRGIIHGDIKPANIGFVGGTPKLIDFGLAKADHFTVVDDGAANVSHTTLAGTIAYMSPEVAAGASRDADLDLWALALSLFESLAGVNPLIAEDGTRTLSNIREMRVFELAMFRDSCPDGVNAFFKSALSSRRADRPASPEEFAKKLRAAIA